MLFAIKIVFTAFLVMILSLGAVKISYQYGYYKLADGFSYLGLSSIAVLVGSGLYAVWA